MQTNMSVTFSYRKLLTQGKDRAVFMRQPVLYRFHSTEYYLLRHYLTLKRTCSPKVGLRQLNKEKNLMYDELFSFSCSSSSVVA